MTTQPRGYLAKEKIMSEIDANVKGTGNIEDKEVNSDVNVTATTTTNKSEESTDDYEMLILYLAANGLL